MNYVETQQSSQAMQYLLNGDNVLILGKAGTGKSTLLHKYLDQVSEDKTVLVVAPTGVAALNVGGFTIHKAFGFFPSLDIDGVLNGRWKPGATTREVLQRIDTLVIDEISMVRADLLDMMDQALRKIRRNIFVPFGGIQLIFVGDLLQLPPVLTDNESYRYYSRWSTPFFFGAQCYPHLHFNKVLLTTVWRQKETKFIDILNQVREGWISPENLWELNQHVDYTGIIPRGWTVLTPRKETVNYINSRMINEVTSGETRYTSFASEWGKVDKNSFNADKVFEYSVGSRVMSVINDPEGKYVNGSFGTIVSCNDDTITVVFDHSGAEVDILKHTWKVQKPKMRGEKISSETVGGVIQFPLILAWAVTIHKAQGKTIPHCYIDLTGGMHAEGQFYVALSRAVDLDNVKFNEPVHPYHITANAELVYRMYNGGF